MSDYKTKIIVAAIDFGTTYSGYAYSWKDEYERDPLKIYTNQGWSNGTCCETLKAPTVVLFDQNGRFDSFGYEAENKYVSLSEEGAHVGWKYFKRFKMKLHETLNIRRQMWLMDDQNNKMYAMDVFSASIKYFKDHLMDRLKDRLSDLDETDIHWVLTVPAIWNDGAKQFMTEAAEKAGIPNDQLTLALEPEAAAIYCKEILVSKAKENGQQAQLESFRPGAQFMILDLGGGTVDITVHEVQEDGSLKELHFPSGGPWGGTMVDNRIEEFLVELFGEDVMQEFKSASKYDDLDLQRTFELKKRTCIDTKEGKSNVRLPAALFKRFKKKKEVRFEIALMESQFGTSVIKNYDKLYIDNDIFFQMFKFSKENLVKHKEHLLRKPELVNVQTLMMVGGFSESEIMKNAVKRAFPNKKVIVPEQAGIAVVKGAVMFGHNTDSIRSRKLPYTYGISTAVPFDESLHQASKKVIRNGKEICEEVFKIFIKAGTTVVPNKTTVEHTFRVPYFGSSTATIEIYRSKSENPVYVSDEGCNRIGEIVIDLQGRSDKVRQMIYVTMTFGDTVLHVEAKENGTQNKMFAKFDFLRQT